MGRPHIITERGQKTVTINYEQTLIEKIANTTSLVTYILLLLLVVRKHFKKEKIKYVNEVAII